MPALRSAARMASRDGSNEGSMSPARDRRPSLRGASGRRGATVAAGLTMAGGADFLRELGCARAEGLGDLGGFFDKCLVEK